ncbi:hypothetical protein OSR38_06555 [Rickettsia conorii subsp. heilongjiangensis]|nr:hypothetical protein OSR38_06555 [Rickettsia conorii subsp. heilongjiangensis]
MMFTCDNTSVNVGGNISGSNITFDLGNNKVTYTGSATPTGELIINVFYDTINAGQTGNANSGQVVGGYNDLWKELHFHRWQESGLLRLKIPVIRNTVLLSKT